MSCGMNELKRWGIDNVLLWKSEYGMEGTANIEILSQIRLRITTMEAGDVTSDRL